MNNVMRLFRDRPDDEEGEDEEGVSVTSTAASI